MKLTVTVIALQALPLCIAGRRGPPPCVTQRIEGCVTNGHWVVADSSLGKCNNDLALASMIWGDTEERMRPNGGA